MLRSKRGQGRGFRQLVAEELEILPLLNLFIALIPMLLISAELEEILTLSDRIAIIYQGEIMGIIEAEGANVEAIGLMMGGTKADQLPVEV